MEFFDNIKTVLESVSAQQVFNYDETNFTDDPGAKKVLVRRVYKANNIYENWTVGGPLGAVYDNSSSGWFDMNLFEVWFLKLLLPHVKENCNGESVVLLGDNLALHFSQTVVKAAKENNIYMAPLPPNSTHFMQPLDVAFFAPMKKKWRAILDDWIKTSRVKGTLPKEHFPNLLSGLWRSLQKRVEDNLKSGFRATGICPYDPQQPLSKLPKIPIDASTSDILNDSLLEFLLETHGQSSTNPKRKRGRKIIPGKEVDCEETKEEQDKETLIENENNDKKKIAEKGKGKGKAKIF
ncbi:uncharacterized protein LOC126745170 [Anthonomus grandis grandis]|uniref:uncharacterized protein LOC126745170 n=1 Tax=Anthonomus grandis grandis TaxID=2921223 RepID=UPI002165FD6B|nr:uncharacterized protein LOC126745170 [Anthonomus grandis grandis]